MDNEILDFGIPEEKHSIIKVIGVGGGGGNAVNHMYKEGIHDVTFVVCNTDNQALNDSPVPVKLQLGSEGLGAGNRPEKARAAAEESQDDIHNMLNDGTRMAFITAGMGGGTGTGAAPVIADNDIRIENAVLIGEKNGVKQYVLRDGTELSAKVDDVLRSGSSEKQGTGVDSVVWELDGVRHRMNGYGDSHDTDANIRCLFDKLRDKAKDLELKIEPRLLTSFKRIRKNARNGLGIVHVQRDACGGCFNKIPPQRQLDIKMHKKIIVCEYCGRIMIDPELADRKSVV